MSCARPPNFLLHKQKSLVCESVCHERRLRLRKQFSVDQNHDISNHRSVHGQNQPKNGKVINSNSWGCNNPEASLRIVTAIKNKTQNHGSEPNEQVQKCPDNDVLPNKSRKKNEEKININIFLAQNVPELDLGSDSESGVKKMKNVNDQSDPKPISNRLTVETRRSQFRQRNLSLSEPRPRLMRAMSAPIRPILPPDAHEKVISSSNQSQGGTKKRLRRKKIAPIEMSPFSLKVAQHTQQYTSNASKLVSQRSSFDERPSTAKSMNSYRSLKSVKPPKTSTSIQPRAKSAMNGCEIITLVSLLSPGASDSEKEDYSISANDSSGEKVIPSLRKIGKSVSFQDDDSFGDDDPIIDLPSVLRRASLVPKIRLNRPPTAPPGSIFHKSNAISEIGMSGDNNKVTVGETGDSIENPISQLGQSGGEISKIPINIVNATVPMRKSSIDIFDPSTVYPEYVRSIKEKECWLLFQKMAKKGITVSYETILRGMLPPNEVRAVEKKQKEIFERQASIELEAATSTECDISKKTLLNSYGLFAILTFALII
ncbi:uncharacterized protein LOC116339320 [Contarinia nasturtii]|uniref:uncharacterized protein LOC116339320 n=1 Tax=Contarinia nasturtii TaxID=265458 RepID=UPI0012D40B00|nr:uncharacterized protein LOC116339320 [Contarinia nasturtii]